MLEVKRMQRCNDGGVCRYGRTEKDFINGVCRCHLAENGCKINIDNIEIFTLSGSLKMRSDELLNIMYRFKYDINIHRVTGFQLYGTSILNNINEFNPFKEYEQVECDFLDGNMVRFYKLTKDEYGIFVEKSFRSTISDQVFDNGYEIYRIMVDDTNYREEAAKHLKECSREDETFLELI